VGAGLDPEFVAGTSRLLHRLHRLLVRAREGIEPGYPLLLFGQRVGHEVDGAICTAYIQDD